LSRASDLAAGRRGERCVGCHWRRGIRETGGKDSPRTLSGHPHHRPGTGAQRSHRPVAPRVTKAVEDVVEASLQLGDAVLLSIGVLKKNVERIVGMMGQDNYPAIGISQGGEA